MEYLDFIKYNEPYQGSAEDKLGVRNPKLPDRKLQIKPIKPEKPQVIPGKSESKQKKQKISLDEFIFGFSTEISKRKGAAEEVDILETSDNEYGDFLHSALDESEYTGSKEFNPYANSENNYSNISTNYYENSTLEKNNYKLTDTYSNVNTEFDYSTGAGEFDDEKEKSIEFDYTTEAGEFDDDEEKPKFDYTTEAGEFDDDEEKSNFDEKNSETIIESQTRENKNYMDYEKTSSRDEVFS